MFNMINPATIFSRNQDTIVPPRQTVFDVPTVDASAFGIFQNAAQNAQNTPYIAQLTPPPAFTETEYKIAQWFTTRVHLNPLGKA